MRRCLALFVLLSAIACGPKPSVPEAEPTGVPDEAPADAGADPVAEKPTLPVIENVTTLPDENPDPDIVEVTLTAQPSKQTVAGLALDLYTFNGQFPGPLLQARKGNRVIVHFKNELPEPTTIHWHGLRIPADMDGSPRIQSPVPAGGTFTYDFIVPDAGSFWYHPHVRANEQIEKGLYAPFVVHSDDDPKVARERYLLVDDILLDGKGFVPFLGTNHEHVRGRVGNVLLTNGSVQGEGLIAVARVGEVERWRVVNTANARTMVLSIENAEFRVVGTDGGPLPAPYYVDKLEVAIGQRYDLEVIYTNLGEVKLLSSVLTRNAQNEVVEVPYDVFRVEVGGPSVQSDLLVWPTAPLPVRPVDATVSMEFDVVNDPQLGIIWRVNGISHAHAPLFTFEEGQTVRMKLKNLVGPEHPFHLHGQFFSVVDDGTPASKQPGLRDVALLRGLGSLEVIAYMDNPGRWMAHCHNLEHAELGMMLELVVTPKN